MKTNHDELSEGLKLLKFLIRWRKILVLVFLLSIAASILSTLLMEPEYRSTAILFPTPTNSPAKILDEPQFGYEVDADWLMQVLKSDIVKDTLVKMFRLKEYFELDTTSSQWIDDLNEEYENLISFERTRYMSIMITVTSGSPELSASIANAVLDKIDPIREQIFKENTYRSLLYYEKAFFEKNAYVIQLVDSIHELRNTNTSSSQGLLYSQIKRKQQEIDQAREELTSIRNQYNFYDLETYVEILNKGLTDERSVFISESGKYEIFSQSLSQDDTTLINSRARIEGARRSIENYEQEMGRLNEIKKKYSEANDRLSAGIYQMNQLKQQYENTLNAFEPFVNSILLERLASDYAHEQLLLNEIRYKYENTLISYQNPIPAVYVINRATPSYRKSSPSLIQNSLIIILSSMIFTIGVLLVRDKFHVLKSALNEKDS